MEKEKITTNRIEEVLLEKKINECVNAVKKAALEFANVVNEYTPSDYNDQKEFVLWAVSVLRTDCWQVFVKDEGDIKKAIPAGITKLLLQRGVDEFIQSVENTKEIIDGLEI